MASLLVQSAAAYAAKKHEGQKYGDQPYTKHLADVAGVLARFGYHSDVMQAAAWLHDSVEDTDAKLDEIKMIFGEAVSEIVGRVTNEPGKNRKERHLKTYPKIKASFDATILKLCDRIANVESSLMHDEKKMKMYKKEHLAFKEAIRTPGTLDNLWRHLDFLIGDIDAK